jgi:hypothetical protein
MLFVVQKMFLLVHEQITICSTKVVSWEVQHVVLLAHSVLLGRQGVMLGTNGINLGPTCVFSHCYWQRFLDISGLPGP